MTGVIVTSALAPLMKEPNPRAEQVSQILSGETAIMVEEQHTWLKVKRDFDDYLGWVNRGYVRPTADTEAWRDRSSFLAENAELENLDGRRFHLPLLARVAPSSDEWELSSGIRGRLVGGSIHPAEALARSARTARPIDWARGHFSGSAYLWGGITPWGVDCSGLIQTTFAARGYSLPRDSQEQANHGLPVPTDGIESGDLLFFSENGERITHVAFAGDDDTLVHSTLACGGFVVESWKPGSRAAHLRDQLVAIRRLST